MNEFGHKINLKIEKLSLGGDGISRAEGLVVFTPYTAPKDLVLAEITERKKTYARAKPLAILKDGPGRAVPPCPHYFTPASPKWCGGCDFQHLSYQTQLSAKVEAFRETLEKLGAVKPEILPPMSMNPGEEWRYRNKMQVPFAKQDGKVVAGFYSPGSHEVVPFQDCLIHSETMSAVVRGIVRKMNEWSLEPYEEKSHRGWLRHVLIREELVSGSLLVTFVTSTEYFPKKDPWIESLVKEFPKIVGICQNLNAEKTNVILGRSWRTLFGQNFLTEKVANIQLKVSASSFFQVNTKMAEKLYVTARDWAGQGKILLDVYCGVGGIGLLCAPNFEKVLGADQVPSAIADAIYNTKLNKISNCRFFEKDARDFLKDLRFEAFRPYITAVLDPPRAGCTQEVLRYLGRVSPSKIVYVSCDPGTLARDLKFLVSQGYKVEKVQPVDLFPQSSHIESVTLLTRS